MGKEVNILVIDLRKPGRCTGCGKTTQVRPYAEDGGFICEECFSKLSDDALKRQKEFVDQFDHIVFLDH